MPPTTNEDSSTIQIPPESQPHSQLSSCEEQPQTSASATAANTQNTTNTTNTTATTATTTTTRRKRRSARSQDHDPVLYPGFGTRKDFIKLAQELSSSEGNPFPVEAVEAMMRSRGRGVPDDSKEDGEAPAANAWVDFMKEEGVDTGGSATAATTTEPKTGRGVRKSSNTASSGQQQEEDASYNSDSKPDSTRVYIETETSAASPSKKKKLKSDASATVAGGVLVQTGTLDASTVGRTKKITPAAYHLQVPTRLLTGIRITRVFTGCNAAHSVAIDEHGKAYGWGRNETSQLGSSLPPNVAYPELLTQLPPIRQAALGKGHSIFLLIDGSLMAVGANKLGQCSVRSFAETIPNFKKCVVSEDCTDVVQVACGEAFSVALTAGGTVYSCGSSEFGQLGNGETGEYFVTASKIAFGNCNVFTARTTFCHAPTEKLHVNNTEQTTVVPLPASQVVRICQIACGKHHTLAVEAPSNLPCRVFSWGCGNYGVLGHGVQADQFFPRVIGILSLLLPKAMSLSVAAGAHCSLLKTEGTGHVYYWGKHRSIGEATMRPQLVDVLANNQHIVTHFGAGGQTVVCTTTLGQTVAWGQGPHGELGLEKAKSSAKPTFVTKLDGCILSDLACGLGHTLFLVRQDDEEDIKAAEKLDEISADDVEELVEKNSTTASEKKATNEKKSDKKADRKSTEKKSGGKKRG